MVVSRDNMWANLQSAAAPWALNWWLDAPTAWLPFFGGDVLPPRHFGTLQPPLRYEKKNRRNVLRLQIRLLAVVFSAAKRCQSGTSARCSRR